MKEEKLKKEAEISVVKNVCADCHKCQSYGYIGCDIYRYSRDSYVRGAESKEKEFSDMTSIASYQQSSNMQRYFTIKDLESDKRRLQGTITQMSKDFNYRITEMGNELERTRIGALNNLDGWRKSDAKLSKARDIISDLLYYTKQCTCERSNYAEIEQDIKNAEKFLKETSHD